MSENFETITYEVSQEVARITINRPETLNALNQQVIAELDTVLSKVVPTSDARLVILSGAGDRAFVAGADISEMQKMNAEEAKQFALSGQRVTRLLEGLPQITMAIVDGFALGGGCELAMACDLNLATTKAKFGQPEVNLGIIAGFGGTQRLVRRVGLPVAMEILCAGRMLSGEEAFSLGLASKVCKPEELDNEVSKIIKKVLKAAPAANALTKKMCRSAYQMNLDDGLNAEAEAFATCFNGEEANDGMTAFLEKRSAKFAR